MPVRVSAALLVLVALGGCTQPVPPPGASTASAAAAKRPQAAQAALHALFRDSDEDELRRNPITALFRGDLRYADRFGDYISDAYFAAERAAAEAELRRLRAIDRAVLPPTDQLSYDVFEYQKEQALRGLTDEMLALTAVRPINHFSGIHTFYPTFSSGTGAAPFNTVEDYENALKRHAQFADHIDAAIGRFREGLASGVVETKLTVDNVIAQLDAQLAAATTESPYYAPVLDFPDSVPQADRARLEAAFRASIEQEIFPAYRRLRTFLADEYLGRARDDVGLSSMKGGAALYAKLIEDTTTLPLGADAIHDLGLGEVARIRDEMEAIKRQVGFAGTLAEFFDFLRTDPQFRPPSRDWLAEEYYRIGKMVDARIGEQFSALPRAPLEIRPVEPFRERTAAGGSYDPGTPDGARPGVFYYNAYNLDERTVWGTETLYLHEGAPGHHFQISLAQENEALPPFMRFGGNIAYVEGWALYAETLGDELGLFSDPYQRFGHLNDEMLRAMRLVVDTGLHAKGWSREQAIRYMLDNSGLPEIEATSEVERYIAIPAQAVAYKIGALKIQELKRRAEQALGARFDPREFHAQVLMTGALPLPVLERKIDRWIESKS